MNTQDRAVVKSLLQYMTDRYLTGSDEFRATLKHFNITTTSCHTHEGFTKTKHVVIVFAADRIDRTPHGFHVEFASKEAAEAYEAKMRATGDELTAADIDALHAEALEMNAEVDLVRWDAAMTAERAMNDACRVADADAAHAEALEIDLALTARANGDETATSDVIVLGYDSPVLAAGIDNFMFVKRLQGWNIRTDADKQQVILTR